MKVEEFLSQSTVNRNVSDKGEVAGSNPAGPIFISEADGVVYAIPASVAERPQSERQSA